MSLILTWKSVRERCVNKCTVRGRCQSLKKLTFPLRRWNSFAGYLPELHFT